MAAVDLLKAWGGPQDVFKTVRVNAEGPHKWEAQLLSTENALSPGLALHARKPIGEERIWISWHEKVPAEIARLLAESPEVIEVLRRLVSTIDYARAGQITCTLHTSDLGPSVEIQAVIYEDGFSRQVLNATLLEITKAHSALQKGYEGIAQTSQMMAQNRQLLREDEERHRAQSSEAPAASSASSAPSEAAPTSEAATTAICPACQATNRASSRFCNQCGGKLIPR